MLRLSVYRKTTNEQLERQMFRISSEKWLKQLLNYCRIIFSLELKSLARQLNWEIFNFTSCCGAPKCTIRAKSHMFTDEAIRHVWKLQNISSKDISFVGVEVGGAGLTWGGRVQNGGCSFSLWTKLSAIFSSSGAERQRRDDQLTCKTKNCLSH